MSETQVVRTVQVEDKVIHVHIHLTDEEVRRLLLPFITSAYMQELERLMPLKYQITCNSTN